MKKTLYFLFFQFLSLNVLAQSSIPKWCDDVSEYDEKRTFDQSYFDSIGVKSHHSSMAMGYLSFRKQENLMSGFLCDSLATLTITPEACYGDYSTKQYQFTSDSLVATYSTFMMADCLSIDFRGHTYRINCIDGGCDVHIKHLKSTFFQMEDCEIMVLKAEAEIPLLLAGQKLPEDPHAEQVLWLLQGSQLVFVTQKKK